MRKNRSVSNPALNAKQRVPTGSWTTQWRHAWRHVFVDLWRQPFATLLTVTVIAISLTLPVVSSIVWKNVSLAVAQWYPAPQITLFFSKTLDDSAAEALVTKLKHLDGVDKVDYLSRDEALTEFRDWSGFASATDLLEQNPLPAIAIVTPQPNFQQKETLLNLRAQLVKMPGVDEVRMDDNWFARLNTLAALIGKVTLLIASLMVTAVLLVIGNSVRLTIFACRDTINIQKLIGATDGFILRPFLYGGAILGFVGAICALILSQCLVLQLQSAVAQVAQVFDTAFGLEGLSWDEILLVLIVATMVGWLAAYLATSRHLKKFTPE